jgi:hypothetical protein
LICLPLWAGLVWFAAPGLNYAPFYWTWYALLGLGAILSVPGVTVGYALARGLTDRAGLVSPVIAVIAAGFAWVVVYGGVEISNQFRPLHDWRSGFVVIVPGVFATLWIVKATLLEE